MGTINVRKISDEAKQKLKVKAAEKGQSLEAYVRQALEDLAHAPQTKSGVKLNLMKGKLGAFKDHDWFAENTEEIEAWEGSELP